MELNIGKDASIDRYNLEKEATNLPSVIARYQEAILEQTRLVDNLKLRRDKEEAVARQDARRALSSTGKPTNDMVNDAVACLPAVIRLRRELAEEERELSYLKSCIGILEVKRRSLDNLVSLYIHAYYDSAQADNGVADGRYRFGQKLANDSVKAAYDREEIRLRRKGTTVGESDDG